MVVYHLDEVLYQGLTEQYGNRNLRRTEINLASSGADKYSLVTKKRLKTKAKCISSHVQVYVVELLKVHIEIESFVFFLLNPWLLFYPRMAVSVVVVRAARSTSLQFC